MLDKSGSYGPGRGVLPGETAAAAEPPWTPSVLVIGAGPAGLSAALVLARRGARVTIVEQDAQVGGISRTVEHRGYRFDIGGHRFFTKSRLVEGLWQDLLGDEFLTRPRLSRIFYRGRLFDYPLRAGNALRNLGITTALAVLLSYVRAQVRPRRPEVSFEDWVTNRFGERLYRIFFKTYTEKVWGRPCREIGAQWAAQRIKGLSLRTAVLGAVPVVRRWQTGGSIKTLVEQFQYPRLGPGQMWDTLAHRLRADGVVVRTGCRVAALEHDGGRVRTARVVSSSGEVERIAVDGVVSTMPLRELVGALSPTLPEAVRAAAGTLQYRDFLTVCLIVEGEDIFPDQWIYVHDESVRLGRIQNFGNWSPHMVPERGRSGLGLEYFCQEDDDLWRRSDAELVALGARELEAIGVVPAARVLDGHVIRVPKAYPVYDHGYEDALAVVRAGLHALCNLEVAGRNGMHKYNNQDHSMVTGMLSALTLLGDQRDAWAVNADSDYHETIDRERLAEDLRAVDEQQPLVPSALLSVGDAPAAPLSASTPPRRPGRRWREKIRKALLRWLSPVAVVALSGMAVVWVAARHAFPVQPTALLELYQPSFRQVTAPATWPEALAFLRDDLSTPRGQAFLQSLLPNQAGMLCVSVAVWWMVALSSARLGWRRLDLLLLQLLALPLFGVMWYFGWFQRPPFLRLLWGAYDLLALLAIALIVRAYRRAWTREPPRAWQPSLGRRTLAGLVGLLLVLNVAIVLWRLPDDAGVFVNLGAQRLRETHRLPYGDPLLTGTPAAAYGPLLYVLHVPAQHYLQPAPPNAPVDRPALDGHYVQPPLQAAQWTALACHLVGLGALYAFVRRLRGRRVALAAVALFASSVAVLGIGGDRDQIAGLTFASHIAPSSAMLLALACWPEPGVAGVLLAAAAGIGFYPLFCVPAWLGFYWRDRRARRQFLFGLGATALIVGTWMLAASQAADGRGVLATILHDTFGHHSDPASYGASPFGLWGQRGGWRAWAHTPLLASTTFSSPLLLALIVVACLAFLPARRARPAQLAALLGAVSLATSLTKIHATGTYLAWFVPLLLLSVLADGSTPLVRSGREAAPVDGRVRGRSKREN